MPKEFRAQLKDLFFDPENPRLIADFGDDQPKMFRYLITDIGVDDLLQSIAASGLFDADPIIVRARPAGGHYVIEGNRRIAALKLLTGERPDQLPLPPIPEVTPEFAESLKTVEVESDWPKERLQAYLGYKHVTAAREWSADAKAKFVFEHAGGDFSKENLRKFAKTVGTTFPTLKRWLLAYFTLKQAERKQLFDPELAPAKGYFGTFYTLLGGKQAQEFLDLQDLDPLSDNPIPEEHLPALAEFISWTIGTRDKPAIVNSRKQKPFEQVLASPKALQHFRVKGDLEASLLYTEYNADEIAAKFRVAAYTVEDCLTKLFDVRENETVKDAFSALEGAYRKAKLNMRGEEEATEE
jgi:hypothetical protein